jgi:DNA-binding winged helix-turn-helix (wHTH) protein
MAHGDRSVDVFVRKLRSKFQKASPEWNYIHTHFGVGYRFAAEPAEVAEGAVSPDGTAPAAAAALPPGAVAAPGADAAPKPFHVYV